MNYFSTLLTTLCVCGGTLLGAGWEWDALITSVPGSAQGSVVPIGTSSYLQGDPIGVDVNPAAIAVTPDGKKALVANQGSDDISVVNLIEKTMYVVPLPEGTGPANIGITPDGTKAVVVGISGGLGSINSTVAILDLTTNPINVETLPFASFNATSLAITPDGKRALIGGSDGSSNGNLFVVDLTTTPASFETSFIPGIFFGGLAVTPNNRRALAVTYDLNTVTMIDLTTKPHPAQIHTVTVGNSPVGVAITPDGKRALVICGGTGRIPTGGITVLDLTTDPMSVHTLFVPLIQGFVPSAIAITPDGKKAVVTASGGVFGAGPSPLATDVLFLDLTTDPISILSTPPFTIDTPTDVAITPDQAPTARFTVSIHGSLAIFKASASTSPIGSIATYKWDFGDGSTETTTSPVITHKYHHLFQEKSHKHCDKPKFVTLTVTNTAGTSTEVTFTGRTVSNNGGPSAVCRNPLIAPPPTFVAEVKVHRSKNELVLKTRWTKSSVKDVKYEIFAHKKKIASISSKDDLKKIIRVHVRHLPEDVSDAYLQHVCSRYRIRAVVDDEVVSPFVYLTEVQ